MLESFSSMKKEFMCDFFLIFYLIFADNNYDFGETSTYAYDLDMINDLHQFTMDPTVAVTTFMPTATPNSPQQKRK